MPGREPELLSATEAALLAFLTDGEMSGYDLARAFSISIDLMWAPAKGHMYMVLPQLVSRGLATSREVKRGKRSKQLYRVTPKGRAAVRRWLKSPVEDRPETGLLLLKIFFGDLVDKETVLSHIRRRREEAEAIQEQLERFERVHARKRLYPSLTRQYGLLWAQFQLQWVERAETAIGAAESAPGEPLWLADRAVGPAKTPL